MRIINMFVIIAICCFLAFFSVYFYIGSSDDKIILKNQLPLSYLYRSLAFLILGLTALLPLMLLNFTLNKIKTYENKKINLKSLLFKGCLAILIASFLSSIFFFLN